MLIYLFTKDELEAQGLKWLLESRMTGIRMAVFDSLEKMMAVSSKERPDLLIIDMDQLESDDEAFGRWIKSVRWLGLSSERMFQTAYKGLRLRAEDVLFRPISPDEMLKCVQQLRFEIRNETKSSVPAGVIPDKQLIDYSDLFLGDQQIEEPLLMASLLSEDPETLPFVYSELQQFPFSGNNQIFALSQFILCIGNQQDEVLFQKEFHSFLEKWKNAYRDPLAIVINTHWKSLSVKEMYNRTRQLTETIFFEGYDIILAKAQPIQWSPLDPFLTPLEQRQWIEMLEKNDIQMIRNWMENDFLGYKHPYPSPEMVRIRMTSVLAQVRRYMKSRNLQDAEWENAYHKVFRQVIQEPVVYRIVQTFLAFTTRLLKSQEGEADNASKTLIEKVRVMMESNYWNPQWNLEDCAETLRMNKSTLSRRFAAEAGKTFRDTLHEIKIGEAKRLLKETDLPIDEIARLVGYHHRTYFNAKFKQLENQTPKKFRMGF